MSSQVIYYALVSHPGGPFFAPNPIKAHLALLHKGVNFRIQEVTYKDLRTTWTKRLGRKATSPLLELPDGTLIQGTDQIVKWLESAYPKVSSLFLPGAALPIDQGSAEYRTAKNYARLVSDGLGDSDSHWTTWWELSAQEIQKLLPSEGPDSDAEYFKTPAKLGSDAEWGRILATGHTPAVDRAHAAIVPLAALLAESPFFAGNEPGLVDYIIYGRWLMMRTAVPDLAALVWAPLDKWREALESRYAEGLSDLLSRLPPLSK